jgi:hypothetical protein
MRNQGTCPLGFCVPLVSGGMWENDTPSKLSWEQILEQTHNIIILDSKCFH